MFVVRNSNNEVVAITSRKEDAEAFRNDLDPIVTIEALDPNKDYQLAQEVEELKKGLKP